MMPIDPIAVQRRLAEQGRIRLGQRVPIGTTGKSRPEKLDRFRFTSPNARLIDDLATLYGGTARPWDNNGMAEFEVVSDAREIPVIVVKGGISQWFETWSGGGCVHRCTGTESDKGVPCNPDDPQHIAAKPTTRLSLMLPELDTMGVWRLESHGWNAAAEIPMIAQLAEHVGDLVGARLSLVERRAVKDGKTSRFVVPVLDLDVNTRRLVELAGGRGGSPALEAAGGGEQRPQIEAGPTTLPLATSPPTPLDFYGPKISACQTQNELNALWQQINANRHAFPDVVEALKDRARVIEQMTPPPASPAAGETEPASLFADADQVEHVDGELVDDDLDTDRAWQDVVTAAGQQKISTSELTAMFEEWAALPVSDGDAGMFRRFLAERLT
jgi:hypothetical protein